MDFQERSDFQERGVFKERLLRLLEPERFRTWLARRNPTDVVGYAQHPAGCPVANYLKASGMVGARVDMDRVFVWDLAGGVCVKSPAWLWRFIYTIDNRDRLTVTAGDALAVLELVENLEA